MLTTSRSLLSAPTQYMHILDYGGGVMLSMQVHILLHDPLVSLIKLNARSVLRAWMLRPHPFYSQIKRNGMFRAGLCFVYLYRECPHLIRVSSDILRVRVNFLLFSKLMGPINMLLIVYRPILFLYLNATLPAHPSPRSRGYQSTHPLSPRFTPTYILTGRCKCSTPPSSNKTSRNLWLL